MPASNSSHLVLVGAGHSHLEVLRRFGRRPLDGVELAVISPGRHHLYSGMVPGYLAGTYTEEQIAVDVEELTRRAGGRHLRGRTAGLAADRRLVLVEDDRGQVREVPYDFVAFAVGSNTAGAEQPAVARHAQLAKPIGRAVELRRRMLELASREEPGDVTVVGGGAGGCEVALAAAAVFAAAAPPHRVSIVESAKEILAGYSARFRRKALRLLDGRGIARRTGSRVAAVHSAEVELENGSRIPSRLTIWLTGPVAWPIFRGSGLPVDERGFLLTDGALRSIADPRVFASGDCGTLACHPGTPKAGVYAVREGPVLWRSLAAALSGGEPPRYRPQKGFMSILNTADGRALLSYKGLASHSRWAWLLKDRIDRRFVARYR